MNNSERILLDIERRFKLTCKLTQDISCYPIPNSISNIEINKEKSKKFSEVFTPLWLVDQMIGQVKFPDSNVRTLDLCSGYGQFSVRLMRYFYNNFPNFSVAKFIRETHSFSELQLSSCYKLLNIFGNQLNLFIGDSTYLNVLPPDAKGIWCYIENYGHWVCLTKTIQAILSPNGAKSRSAPEKIFIGNIANIIQSLNQIYGKINEMHNLSLKSITGTQLGRLTMIKDLNHACSGSSKQSVDTPQSIITDMVSCVEDLELKSILVMFNIEIVEQLIHKKKIDPRNITFAIEHGAELKAKAVKAMYGVDYLLFDTEMTFVHQTFKGKKFDVCFSNPPYNDHVHLKILMALYDANIANEYMIVHPSNWLIDQKGDMLLFNNFKTLVSGSLKSVNLFNGNTVFDIGLFYPCVITHIDKNHKGDIDVKYFDDKYIVKSISEITKYGPNWANIVSPLVNKLKGHIKTHHSIWSKNIKKISDGKSYCQLAVIRGHVGKNGSLFEDDFYTMVMKNSENNKGIRKLMNDRPGPTFEFNTETERDNFIQYLKTDFARFCLSLYKISANLFYGEMNMIPCLDFTQSWDDEKLFNYFDINQETQDYIRKFLPDYYEIRKTNGSQTKTIGLSSPDLHAQL